MLHFGLISRHAQSNSSLDRIALLKRGPDFYHRPNCILSRDKQCSQVESKFPTKTPEEVVYTPYRRTFAVDKGKRGDHGLRLRLVYSCRTITSRPPDCPFRINFWRDVWLGLYIYFERLNPCTWVLEDFVHETGHINCSISRSDRLRLRQSQVHWNILVSM